MDGNHRNPITIPMAAPNLPNAHMPTNHGQRRTSQSGSASEMPGSPWLGNIQIEPANKPRWIAATTTGHAVSKNLFENLLISSSHPTFAFTFGAERDVKCEAWLASILLRPSV
jgi:hypothetical protein